MVLTLWQEDRALEPKKCTTFRLIRARCKNPLVAKMQPFLSKNEYAPPISCIKRKISKNDKRVN